MGRHSGSFTDAPYVLAQFSNDDRIARKAYPRFVGEGIALGPNPGLTRGRIDQELRRVVAGPFGEKKKRPYQGR